MDILWPEVLMYVVSMMFGWIIAKVLKAGLVVELEVLLRLTTRSISFPLLVTFVV